MSKIKSVSERAEAVDDGSERLNRIAVQEFTADRQAFEEALCEALTYLYQVPNSQSDWAEEIDAHNKAIDQAIATVRAIYQGNKE